MRRHDPVSEAADRLDQVGRHLLAEPPDEHLDGVGIAIEVLVIEVFDQLGPRHHAVTVVHQVFEHLVLVRGQLDRVAVDRHAPGPAVEAHRADLDLVRGMTGGAPNQRADPGEHLLDVEGLGDIVVGAGIDALHLVAPAIARREDQHRHLAAVPAPFLEHRDAVHLRQADVQHHRVIGLGIAEEMALLAVLRGVDRVAGFLEGRDELPIEISVVLDDEHPHALFPSFPVQ